MDESADAAIELMIAGERMCLLADRALYWPARRRLLIADLHLGKGDVLRAAGIPVPSGGTGHDLARLGTLLETTGAGQLWVLGDFLHGPRQPRVEALWRACPAGTRRWPWTRIRASCRRSRPSDRKSVM